MLWHEWLMTQPRGTHRKIREQEHIGWGTPDLKVAQLVALVGYLFQQLGLPGW